MEDRIKQRLFWIITAVIIAGMIFSLSAHTIWQIKTPSNMVSDVLSKEQQNGQEQIINLELVGILRRTALFFLYALFGFTLNFVFTRIQGRMFLSIGAASVYATILECFLGFSDQHFSWLIFLINLGGILIGAGIAPFIVKMLKYIKKWFSQTNNHHRLETVLEWLSLASVLHYTVYRFLQSTMFQLYFSNQYKMLTILLMICFGGLRFLYLILKEYWAADTHKAQSFLILQRLLSLCLAIPFVLVGWMHDYKVLIFLPFCCMCLYKMIPEKVCRAFVAVIGTCLVALILCSLSGTVRSIVNTQKQFASSFGVINTTDFASYFTFLLLSSWCGMRSHKVYASIIFAAVAVGMSYLVYQFVSSRTAMYLGILIAFFVLWDCLEEKLFHRAKAIRMIGKGINWLSLLAFPAVGAFVVFLSIRYAAHDTWALQLETVLSGRLATVIEPFRTYGVHPFGSTVDKMYGFGRTILGEFWSAGYGYLDVAYAMLAIRYGWVITMIITGLWIWMTAKALRSGKKRFALSLAVLAMHGFSEARILDVNYNIFLIMPFCAFVSEKQEVTESMTAPKPFLGPALVKAGIIGLNYLILPRILSWLRTFFSLKGWNNGTSAFFSFIFCAGLVFFLYVLSKTASGLFGEGWKKKIILLSGIVILLTIATFSVNTTIERERKAQAIRLIEEEELIRQIQEVATMPIYAAESEELYRRDGIALASHIFPTEELGRKKGSILVDGTVEAFSIIQSSGQYTQITDKSGLYSYDQAVIDYLYNTGYQWSHCYTGKRDCNLQDTALFNELKTGEPLVLREAAQVVTKNIETDQLSGTYKVVFSLSNFSSDSTEEAVFLEVIGEAGNRIIALETLSEKDFDTMGHCTHTITYQIKSTPLVSYAISVREGVSVTVDGISWQRIDLDQSRWLRSQHPDSIDYSLTGHAEMNEDGSVTFTTDMEENLFNSVVLYIRKMGTTTFLPVISATSSLGHFEGIYTHQAQEGDYFIRFKANGNKKDEWIEFIANLEENRTYQYTYEVEVLEGKKVIISNYSFLPI